MTFPAPGIAHVSFSRGGLFFVAQNPAQRERLVWQVVDYARAHGIVQVLLDGKRWLVHDLDPPVADGCAHCGDAADPACHLAGDGDAALCPTCAFAPITAMASHRAPRRAYPIRKSRAVHTAISA